MKSGYLPPLAAALLLVMHGAALAHGDEDHGAAPTPAPTVTAAPLAIPQRQADGSLFIPKAIQRQWGLRTVKTDIRDLPLSVELSGKVVADATAGGRVQSTQPGRIVAPAQGLPTLGQQVRKGQVLAHVQPTVSGTERGGLQAQLADLDAQQTIAKRKAERYDQLQGAVPQSPSMPRNLNGWRCASAGRHFRPASTRPNCCAPRSPVWSVRCMSWRARSLMPAKPFSKW